MNEVNKSASKQANKITWETSPKFAKKCSDKKKILINGYLLTIDM